MNGDDHDTRASVRDAEAAARRGFSRYFSPAANVARQAHDRESGAHSYRTLLKELNNESLSSGSGATLFGALRRHTLNHADARSRQNRTPLNGAFNALMLAAILEKTLKSGISLSAMALVALLKDMPAAHDRLLTDPLDPQATVITLDVTVPHSVYMTMTQAESLARANHMAIGKIFAESQFMGPHLEQKPHYESLQAIENKHVMRFDPWTQDYAFCAKHLEKLSRAAPDADAPAAYTLKAFMVVAAAPSSRGLKVGINADGAMTQNDIQAAEKAAPVISVPPHLKMVLG